MTEQLPVPGVGLPRAAAAIAVAAWGCAVLAVALAVLARPPVDESLWFFVVDVTVAAVYGTVSALILARRPHPVGWILALAAVGGGLAAVGFAYPMLAERLPGLPVPEVVDVLQSTAWVPGTLALFTVVPWLVRDHPLGRARWGVVVGTALIVAFLAFQALGVEEAFVPTLVAIIVAGLVAAADAERRHRSGPVAERNGLGWLALGAALLALSFVPLVLPYGSLPIPVWTTPVLHLMSQAVYPAAILVAVLRGRMWGLRLAVSRTVLAGLMTVGLSVVYVVVTVAVTRLVPESGIAPAIGAVSVALGGAARSCLARGPRPPPRLRRRCVTRPRRAHPGQPPPARGDRRRPPARARRGRRLGHAPGVRDGPRARARRRRVGDAARPSGRGPARPRRSSTSATSS